MNRIKQKSRLFLPVIIILGVSLIILTPQLIGHHIIIGDDCWFHMNRAYEDMMQLKTGHFSYFLNLFSFNSSGRIVNGLYGPLGGYLEGLLLFISKTWYRWEILNSLIVLIISGLSMYYVSRKLGAYSLNSILVSIIYMTSFPFNRWVLGQNFDGFGAILLPWFLLMGYQIFQHKFSSVKLALLVTVMIQLHLMSTFVGINSLLLSFILANFNPGRYRIWGKVIKASGLCLLLTANVWGSLLEVVSSNYLVPTFPYSYKAFFTPGHALHLSMFIHPIVNSSLFELFIILILSLIFISLHNFTSVNKFLVIQGLYFLWISSKYFPWLHLLNRLSMTTSYIQFPERFLPIAIIAILLLAAKLKPHLLMSILLLIAVIINISVSIKHERVTVNNQYRSLMNSSINVRINKDTSYDTIKRSLHSKNVYRFLKLANNQVPDYMPLSRKICESSQYYQIRPDIQNLHNIINNQLHVHRNIINQNTEELIFNVNPNHYVKLPVVKYSHTKLRLNHKRINPKLNQIHEIRIYPTHYHNVLTVRYVPGHWYIILIFIEIITWLILFVQTCWEMLNCHRYSRDIIKNESNCLKRRSLLQKGQS